MNPVSNSNKPIKKIVSIGAIIAILALAGGGYYWWQQNQASDSSSTSSSSSLTSDTEAVTDSEVVPAANAFLATLSSDQKTKALLEFNEANATAWSNFPSAIYGDRVGIQMSELNDTQKKAVKTLLKSALGTGTGSGYDQVMDILAADDYLGTMQSDYGQGNYYLAFLGTPSDSGTWELQFGGHHLAVANVYKNGKLASATPSFRAVEPTSWTADGTTTTPLDQEFTAAKAVVASLSDSQKATAKLSSGFGDVVVGPQKDGQFPTTKSGIKVSELSDAQKEKVLAYINTWVADVDDDSATTILAKYKSELDDTYVSFAGTGEFASNGDYLRIDGPSVWIEFSCQSGVVIRGQVHYHAVWRDRTNDYANAFSF